MNVNSDDDAHTRATSSTRERVGEEAAALTAVLLREREAREAGVAPRVPASPTGTPRPRRRAAAFGAILSSASRRTDARSSSRSSERVKLVNSGPFAATVGR